MNSLENTRTPSEGTDPGSAPGFTTAPGSRRLSLLMALYVSQAIPLGFFIEAVPAIGRSLGISLRDIGLIQALALPYMIKFLWAPVVDGLGSERRGHYRSWLVPLQTLAVGIVAIIAWLDPVDQIDLLLGLGAVFMLLAATQDIATDGLAVNMLASSERGVGNGVQVGGYYLGQILGGGLMLILFSHFGWRLALLAMAAFLAVPLFNLISFREEAGVRKPATGVDYRAIGRFFRRPGAGVWVAVLLLYRAGDAMAITMMKPMLVDFGYSLAQIGLIVGVGNSAAALGGALLGGTLIERVGRKPALIIFATLQGVALLGFGLPALKIGGLPTIWASSMVAAFAGGMATTALYTVMMDRSNRASAGTDFTLQQSLAAVGPLIGASLSGLSAATWGYPSHFVGCAMLSFLVVGLIVWRLPAAQAKA